TQQRLIPAFRRLSLGVTAVHDEIKPERRRTPFLAHGVLFVPDEWRDSLLAELSRARRAHAFTGEVHFRDIKGASQQNRAFLVARDWISGYFARCVRGCPFKAFIIEQDRYQRFPYPGDFRYEEHLVRSEVTSLTAAIAWSFYQQDLLRIRIVHDDTGSELDRAAAQAVPARLQEQVNRRHASAKRYPWIRVSAVEFVDSNPRNAPVDHWDDSELVQLCDLLLGASFDALELSAVLTERPGRRALSASVLEVLGQT